MHLVYSAEAEGTSDWRAKRAGKNWQNRTFLDYFYLKICQKWRKILYIFKKLGGGQCPPPLESWGGAIAVLPPPPKSAPARTARNKDNWQQLGLRYSWPCSHVVSNFDFQLTITLDPMIEFQHIIHHFVGNLFSFKTMFRTINSNHAFWSYKQKTWVLFFLVHPVYSITICSTSVWQKWLKRTPQDLGCGKSYGPWLHGSLLIVV